MVILYDRFNLPDDIFEIIFSTKQQEIVAKLLIDYMKKNDIKNSSDLFLYKSKIDLNCAKILLNSFNTGEIELDLEIIFFHLQQSVEKLIKSILSKHRISAPKTHDIEELIRALDNNNIKILGNIDKLIDLSEYAIEGRYAIIHDDVDDAHNYIILIEKIINKFKKN